MFPRSSPVLVATAGVLLLGGLSCSGKESFTEPPGPPPVVSVDLSAARISVPAGETEQVTAVPKSATGSPLDRPVTWASDPVAVATVNSSGVVQALTAGQVAITASSGGRTGTITLQVTPPPVASVVVSPGTANVIVNATQQLQATTLDANGGELIGRAITWSSTSTTVATVGASGLVTGKAVGTAYIRAESESRKDSAVVTVALVPVHTVTVTPNPGAVFTGQTLQLTAALRDANNNTLTGRAVTWSSGNTARATVNAQGRVTGVSAGSVTITATSEGKSGTTSVTVSNPVVSRVVLNPDTVTLHPVWSEDLTATAFDASDNEITGRTFTWSSSHTSIATVNSTGRVTGVAAGVARIRATTEGKTDSTWVFVELAPVETLTVSPKPATVVVGGTTQLAALLKDGRGNTLTGRTVTWVSRTPAAVTVNSSGRVTGVAAGTAVVEASVDDARDSTTVTSTATSGGTLAINISGLPTGVAADVEVTGPNNFARTLTASTIITGLVAGSYTIRATGTKSGSTIYAPTPAYSLHNVGSTTITHNITYAAHAGVGLNVTISGFPTGATGGVRVTGPLSYSRTLQQTTQITGLVPGYYTVTPDTLQVSGVSYAGNRHPQTYWLQAGSSVPTYTVTYAAITGRLTVTVSGLPGGSAAAVTVTGPSYSQTVTATRTLDYLQPGTYTVAAASVSAGSDTYVASPAQQGAAVTAGATAGAVVGYSRVVPGQPNLRIDMVHVNQATQRYDGTVPMVKDRPGLLRAFVLSDQPLTARPRVRVRAYQNGTLAQTYTIEAQLDTVPTAVNAEILTSSWNVLLPGSVIQAGLSILVDVDPDNTVVESNENDNRWPVTGTARAMTVRTIPTFKIRWVPIRTPDGKTGNATETNKNSLLNNFRSMMPIGSHDADVRAVYTTTSTTMQLVLSEIRTLYNTETTASTRRHYYGVWSSSSSNGIAGIAYVGTPVAVGNTTGWVITHELGHNLGRWHAPCGNPSSVDATYPYSGGRIGVPGYDPYGAVFHPSTERDVMSYCSPRWISDYNYEHIMTFLEGRAWYVARTVASTDSTLMVYGQVEHGRITLQPTFMWRGGEPTMPQGQGRYRVVGIDANGTVLFRHAFEPTPVAMLDNVQGFAFGIPVSANVRSRLVSVRVEGPGHVAQRASVAALREASGQPPLRAVIAEPEARSTGPGEVTVTWDATMHPLAVIRDAITGEILSLAQGGRVTVVSRASAVDVSLSDGVRTGALMRVPVR